MRPMGRFGVGLDHEVGQIVGPGNSLSAYKTFVDNMPDPSQEGLHMLRSRVMLRIVGSLLCGGPVDKQSSGLLFVC